MADEALTDPTCDAGVAMCPICHDTVTKACSGRCMHKFCYECLLQWCSKKITCPTCRQDLEFIELDPAFDAVVNCLHGGRQEECKSVPSAGGEARSVQTLLIDYGRGGASGVSIGVKKGPGFVIKGLSREGLWYRAGLRAGDIVYELNGFPCSDIRVAIDVINGAQLGCQRLRMRLTRRGCAFRLGAPRSTPEPGLKALVRRALRKAMVGRGVHRNANSLVTQEEWEWLADNGTVTA